MLEFIWIDWNRAKIAAHALGESEVEYVVRSNPVAHTGNHPVNGEFCETVCKCPSGRPIRVVWRYDEDWDGERKAFVITAY